MHPNAELIRKFYTAFAKRDARGMAACYDPAVKFSDEVFTDLEGARANAMWQMLCERGKDLKIEFRDIEADDTSGPEETRSPASVTHTLRELEACQLELLADESRALLAEL